MKAFRINEEKNLAGTRDKVTAKTLECQAPRVWDLGRSSWAQMISGLWPGQAHPLSKEGRSGPNHVFIPDYTYRPDL